MMPRYLAIHLEKQRRLSITIKNLQVATKTGKKEAMLKDEGKLKYYKHTQAEILFSVNAP